ncbi:CLUMA_CG002262, isoform A [Clunio marinus]|uniref:CLUMA_CG002262, isoform A n=1 Tax=Clunio marinus TaxID=568069 RepID=A0A1J1HKD4_9DIPT|nr:CLUMA_CG002262, isoform A [Clunio marinus]
MTFIMATEAQRLISISLAKIAASRCVRGGVSLHKNLLVATVLQKARYIFMEEAFHMVHGTNLNQANSKFIQQLREQERLEHELRQQDKEYDDDDDTSSDVLDDDSELDLFSSPIDSTESLNFLSESSKDTGNSNSNKLNSSTKENNPSLASTSTNSTSDLVYLDLDINRVKPQDDPGSVSISGQKRRLDDSDFETEEAILSILPKSKQIKFNNSESSSNNMDTSNSSDITTDNCLSLDFLSNDLSLTSNSPTHTASVTMAPLDMSSNNNTSATSPTSSIDRITSLVSIFNFGSLQRSVSSPDLCLTPSSHHHVDNSCCNLNTQHQIAMTV